MLNIYRLRNDHEKAEGRLPIPRINFNRGNPEYMVNLIELPAHNEYLRDTLFYGIYQDTILIDTIEMAQEYREMLGRVPTVPTIYTRDGAVMASNGLMSPKPPANVKIPFIYGELPVDDEINTKLEELQDGMYMKF